VHYFTRVTISRCTSIILGVVNCHQSSLTSSDASSVNECVTRSKLDIQIYKTLCPELSTLQKYQKTQLWCCRTSRGIAYLKTLMHITRSMLLQQQNHEKLQVFHGHTSLKCAEQSTGHLSTYQTRREQRGPLPHWFLTFPPCISEIKCTMSLLELWRLWKAQATANICTCSTSTCSTTQTDKKFQFFKHSKLWSNTQAYCKGYP